MNKVAQLVKEKLMTSDVKAICSNVKRLAENGAISWEELDDFVKLMKQKEPRIFSKAWFNPSFNKLAWLVRKLFGVNTYWWSKDDDGREQRIKFLEGLN